MTREDMNITLTQLKNKAEELAVRYNEAMFEKRYEDAVNINNEMVETVNEYTATIRDITFAECKDADDPMLEAVTRLTFTTIASKDVKTKEDTVGTRVIVEKERPIDLRQLNKHCRGIGADPNWVYMIEKFNMLLTARKADELGIDPRDIHDSYAMSKIAKEYDLGKNPASKTNILKTLNTIIAAMLGEGYKATSHDVNYLISIYSKKGREALTVSCANHRYMTNYVAEICYRIVNDKTYGVEYKKAKATEPAK